MSIAVAYPTMADLLALQQAIGDVPPERILLNPIPGTVTEADVANLLEAYDKRLCELVDGVLVEKAMGFIESHVAMVLGALLTAFVKDRKLGVVTGLDGAARLLEGSVRIPDVAVIAWERFPDGRFPTAPIPTVAPNLAVEVLSPSNTVREMHRKRMDYFSAGVDQVWQIDPRQRTLTVFRDPDANHVYSAADSLACDGILQGTVVPIGDLFADLDRTSAD